MLLPLSPFVLFVLLLFLLLFQLSRRQEEEERERERHCSTAAHLSRRDHQFHHRHHHPHHFPIHQCKLCSLSAGLGSSRANQAVEDITSAPPTVTSPLLAKAKRRFSTMPRHDQCYSQSIEMDVYDTEGKIWDFCTIRLLYVNRVIIAFLDCPPG